ncbi:MAG: FHA domain-containing protein, partial [Lentisphaeria bacterium]|nr:FHA domain-containing protein [Lentisphaeria bacterium]
MGVKSSVAGMVRQLFGGWRKRKGPEQLGIRLEFNRKTLYETTSFSSSDAITIGRSSDCVWVIPKEDHVASGHHAVILMRQGRLCLRDTGSRNGIFYKSRKIQEKDLAPNDQFTIGSCVLIVERIKNIRTSPHELVYLNTSLKGQSVKLEKACMTVGSAPGCDLVIDEQLVSQRHAEFSSKADGCWLKDLGSKNGTFVNGTKLSSNTERLLADDDVISISFVDFRFVDGKIEHSKVRIWSSLGVVGVTILAVLALNWFWMNMKSSSETCLGYARKEAAAQRFARAMEYLKESRTRRGAESSQIA